MITISFENPIYLWYLLSIPLLIYTHFYFLRHNKTKALKFANFEALKRVTGEKLITKNRPILALRLLILLCVILAVSGTVFWYEGKINDNDFVIALDVSASMAAQDISPTRLEAAKQSAINFIDTLDSRSNIGVVTFSSVTLIETPLIDNKGTLKKIIGNVDIAPAGGTDIAGAMITGTNLLINSEKGKTIILITDGSNTASSFMQDSIENGVSYAEENHVIVHTIGIGSESGPIGYLPEYYNISAVYNDDNLLDISNQTGGFHFRVFSEEDFAQVSQKISQASTKAMIPIKLHYGLMLITLLLLFIEWGLINTRFKKLP